MPSPRQGQVPWDGLTASLDMEPLASRFDSPRTATPTASLTFLFSHTWDSRRVLLQTLPDRHLNRRVPLYPLPVEVPVAIFYVGLSAGVFFRRSAWCGCAPKKANSLPSPRQGQVPWDGLTASLDMEPLASRFDSPRTATPTASLTFLFSHTWDSAGVTTDTVGSAPQPAGTPISPSG